MNVFIYQAALLCEDCGEAQCSHLDEAFAENGAEPIDRDDESSFDSDRYPKGPYSDGGGEADSPQHCDHCSVFLDNPLTPDGEAYVRSLWAEYVAHGRGRLDILQEWRYAYDWVWDAYADQALGIPRLTPEERERFYELAG